VAPQSTDNFFGFLCISYYLCLYCAMLHLREDAHLLGRFTIIVEEVPQMSSTDRSPRLRGRGIVKGGEGGCC